MNERETLAKLLDFVFAWTLKAFLLVLPCFWLPLTADYFEFNKVFLFYGVTLVLISVWGLKMLVTRTVYFRPTAFDLPLFLILLTTTVAAVLSTNQYYSLFGVTGNFAGTLPLVVAGYGFFYSVVSNCSGGIHDASMRDKSRQYSGFFVIGSVVSAVLYLLNLIGVPLGSWSQTAGSGVETVITYLLAALLAAAGLYRSFKEGKDGKEEEKKKIETTVTSLGPRVASPEDDKRRWIPYIKNTIYMCALTLLLTAVLLTATPLRTFVSHSLEVSNAPLPISWSVAATTIASRPYFGSGPATWQNDYALYKPISANESPDWNTRFNLAGSFYLQILAETGILGFLAWIFLIIGVIRSIRGINIVVGMVLLLWVFTPGSVVGWVVFLLSIGGATLNGDIKVYKAPMTATALACIIGLLVSFFVYKGYQVYAAEYYFKQSLDDLVTNQGRRTYQLQQLALGANPWVDRYHRAYVQTNLALAATILQEGKEGQEETVNALLTQGSREVQALTEVLGPASPENWEARGNFYRQLVNVSKDAASLALGAYQNAVSLDPYSPRLRWELGQAYQTAGDINNAIAAFRVAILLKSDFASAHYSLAQAYKENKQYEAALAELKSVGATLAVASERAGGFSEAPPTEEMNNVNKEIAELEKLVAQANVAGATAVNAEVPAVPSTEAAPITEAAPAPILEATPSASEASPSAALN